MKRMTFLLLITSAFSCSKEKAMFEQKDLIGTWGVKSVDYIGMINTDVIDVSSFNYKGMTEVCDLIITFEEDSKKVYSTGNLKIDFYINDELQITVDEVNAFNTGIWDTNGENLTISPELTDEYYKINKITIDKISSDNMIISTDETLQREDGISGEYQLKGTYTLVKK